jgi:hypothetical protein
MQQLERGQRHYQALVYQYKGASVQAKFIYRIVGLNKSRGGMRQVLHGANQLVGWKLLRSQVTANSPITPNPLSLIAKTPVTA